MNIQKNISILVGNGFDIQILSNNNIAPTTTYNNFYEYVKLFHPTLNNELIENMERDRQLGKENWSDFENTIGELLKNKSVDIESLKKALVELQYLFSEFLDKIVTPQLLKKIDDNSKRNEEIEHDKSLPLDTLEKFLGDLDEIDLCKIRFREKIEHHDFINYSIFNFNYTSLFDSYIYLDKSNFDPHPYATSVNNHHFNINPKNVKAADLPGNPIKYCQSDTIVIHPHGTQQIPRSMLFGIDNIKDNNNISEKNAKFFLKPYWARNDERYKKIINEADLFIIYGLSLGKSDHYWWKSITQKLLNCEAELIIYNYTDENTLETKEKCIKQLLEAAGNYTEKNYSNIKEYVFIINHNSTDNKFAFNTSLKQDN